MKKNYVTPKTVVYSFIEREIFTAQSGEYEVVIPDEWDEEACGFSLNVI